MRTSPQPPRPQLRPRQAVTRPAVARPAAPVLKAVEGGAASPSPARRRRSPPRPGRPPRRPSPPAATVRAAVPAPSAALRFRFRFRHLVLGLSFLVCVALPLAATVLYLYTRAADQYHSGTDFSVRSAEVGASAAAGILGALTMVGGGSASDTDILFDYIRSQEMVQAVDARLDLRTVYNRAGPLAGGSDFFFSLGDAPSIEALTDYWNRMVKVDLDTQGGIIHVRANAFTPGDATAIARAILEESSALVNRLSEQAREDAVRFAREELAETEAKLKAQRAQITDFRRENRLVDPGADVAGQMGLLNALQGELAKAMVERDQLLSFVGPDDQRVVQAERRIDAIETRIDAERSTLGAEGSGTTLTDVVGGYEALKVDLEFAQAAYTQALAAETAARAEARRQSRYLAPHVTPTRRRGGALSAPGAALGAGAALPHPRLGHPHARLLQRPGRQPMTSATGAAHVQADAELLRNLLDFAYAGPGPKRWHVTRFAMYRTLGGRLAQVDGPACRCLSISGSTGLGRVLGLRQATFEDTAYPEVTMTDLPYPDGSFDVVVSDQVLEHVAGDPFRAVAESLRVLRPGGHAVHTTCFINEVHGAPSDFWRFTPQALALLGTTAGAAVVLTGGWGNRIALKVIDLGFRMAKIPEDAGNPVYQIATRNEPGFPITTWVILRKPA